MPQGQKVDRQELHRYLWMTCSRNGKIEIHQGALAEKLGITQPTLSLVMTDLKQEGRIKKIASKPHNVGVYIVRNPGDFDHEFDPGEETIAPGIYRCRVCGEFEGYDSHPRHA